MAEIIAGVLISFFAVVGIAEVWRCIKKYLLSTDGTAAAFVVTCAGHDEQIEYRVRSLANQADDLGLGGSRLVVIVDAGMDEETLKICVNLARDIDGVMVCKINELPTLFSGQLQN